MITESGPGRGREKGPGGAAAAAGNEKTAPGRERSKYISIHCRYLSPGGTAHHPPFYAESIRPGNVNDHSRESSKKNDCPGYGAILGITPGKNPHPVPGLDLERKQRIALGAFGFGPAGFKSGCHGGGGNPAEENPDRSRGSVSAFCSAISRAIERALSLQVNKAAAAIACSSWITMSLTASDLINSTSSLSPLSCRLNPHNAPAKNPH
jgi:hypothetical protein